MVDIPIKSFWVKKMANYVLWPFILVNIRFGRAKRKIETNL